MQGFVLVGPALHYWYQTLGRVVTATGSSGATTRTVSLFQSAAILC